MTRVLFVDDDEDFLALARQFIAREDPAIHIVTSTSAQQALQQLTKEQFDVIVADYQMPGINGLELLERLRMDGNSIPFIIFTGRGREDVAIQALNLGADRYLKKGDELRSLFAELSNFISKVIAEKQDIAGSSRTIQTDFASRPATQSKVDLSVVVEGLSRMNTALETQMAAIHQDITREFREATGNLRQQVTESLDSIEKLVKEISNGIALLYTDLKSRMANIRQEISTDLKETASTSDLPQEFLDRLHSVEKEIEGISVQTEGNDEIRAKSEGISPQVTAHLKAIATELRQDFGAHLRSIEKQMQEISRSIAQVSQGSPIPAEKLPEAKIPANILIATVRQARLLNETTDELITFFRWKNRPADRAKSRQEVLQKLKAVKEISQDIAGDSQISAGVKDTAQELNSITVDIEKALKGSKLQEFLVSDIEELVESEIRRVERLASKID
ncbi:MAG: response regulator [Candidatus Hodarchaeota archaeon]